MKIKKNAMIHSYAQSMGIEAAKDLITKKIKSAALEEKEHYTEEEVAKICGELIKEGGLIRIVAQSFVIQLERKRSEEQALLLDNIETQIWYLTDIETYGAVNKAHAEFLGMEKRNLEGDSLYDIVGREEAGVSISGNREVFEKKKQTRTEEWIKNGRGKTRLLSITRTPKIDDNGTVEYVICAAEDVTDRKQAEEHIEHLNSVLKAIRDVNQAIIVEKDRDSLLQKACNALVDARGYDAAWLALLSDGGTFATVVCSGFREDISRFCKHVMGGDHTPCIKNALAQKDTFMLVDKSRECEDCFFKNAHTDKEVAIIRVEHANRLFGLLAILFASDVAADEEEKGLLKEVAGDISFALHDMEMAEARKQAEEALKESEEKYRALLTNINDLVMEIDSEGKFTYVSPQIFDMFGYTQEESIGLTAMDFMHPDDIEKCMKAMETLDEVKQIEYRSRHKDGHYVHVSTSGRYIRDGVGGFKIVSILRDITERKQAEEKIKAKSLFLESLIQQSPLPTFVMDSKGFVVIVNEAFLKFYAVPNKEMVLGGNALTEPANVSQGIVKYFKEALSGKIVEMPEIEFVSPHKNKKVITRCRMFPIVDPTGTLTNVVVMQEDITERKQAEEKVKEAYRLREHFLKETSHRIITPVAIIGGHTDLLLESSNLDDDQKEKIRIIRERNEEVQKLVRDALVGKYLEEEGSDE